MKKWFLILFPTVLSLLFLFVPSFKSSQALFNNDGPLGVQHTAMYAAPAGFFGVWGDLYWVGMNNGSYPLSIYSLMRWVLGPVGYLNFCPMLCLLFSGWCAAIYSNELGWKPWASSLTCLATALNGNFFSNAAWGLPSRAACLGLVFLALSALHSSQKDGWGRWLIKTVLAGLAVGLAVSEAGDNGAIFSLFVTVYTIFLGRSSLKSFGQVGIMAVTAAAMAAPAIQSLVLIQQATK